MKIAFTDFETTGLRPTWHEVIEIGCVIFDDNNFKIIDTFEAKVRPIYPQRIDPIAQALNGFSEKEWKGAPGAHDTWTAYAKLTAGCVFMAQNVAFDYGFLQEVMKHNPTIPFALDKYKLDLVSISYAYRPRLKSYSLKSMCAALDIPPEPEIHRALNGAMKGYEVYKTLIKKA